jgi:hypothetical protein
MKRMSRSGGGSGGLPRGTDKYAIQHAAAAACVKVIKNGLLMLSRKNNL